MRSRKKLLFTIGAVAAVFILLAYASPERLERLESIYRSDVKGASTAQGRAEAGKKTSMSLWNAPIFGHGLGTSLEAVYNTIGRATMSHDLYLQAWQELGILGLIIFLWFLAALTRDYFSFVSKKTSDPFLRKLSNATGAWLFMNLFFSFFSYGLSAYSWYLIAGLLGFAMRLHSQKTALAAYPS